MKEKRNLLTGIGLISAFALWTVLIQCVDVQAVGQNGTKIGLAAFNVWFHQLIGQNMFVKTIIEADDGRTVDVLTMGPIGITPKLKRKGYGKALLDYSLEKDDPGGASGKMGDQVQRKKSCWQKALEYSGSTLRSGGATFE